MGKIIIAGLGPGDSPQINQRVWDLIEGVKEVIFRTEIHPSAHQVRVDLLKCNKSLEFSSFDALYEAASSFDELYAEMVNQLIERHNRSQNDLLYLVPGSPFVAEKTVELLRATGNVEVEILPGVSFLELVWAELQIDPFAAGVTLIDASEFHNYVSLNVGPLLLTQAWSNQILSDVKLALEDSGDTKVVVLKGLGTLEKQVIEIEWNDIDRVVNPDHLTTLFIPTLPAVPGPPLVELYQIISRLRSDCPWDAEQTHQSLMRHLLEESYEVIDVIEKMTVTENESELAGLYEDFKSELGDLLVQVYFHANLAHEDGRFSLAEVANTAVEKLVRRHPHVFSDLKVANSGEVVSNWEKIKHTQEGRSSILDGIPEALPAFLLASKLLRKAEAVGIEIPEEKESLIAILDAARKLSEGIESSGIEYEKLFGELLWAVCELAKIKGVDLESSLRSLSKVFMRRMRSAEIALG